jgi:bifunctional oligoribonuclease and PAP phosphatase NrnA
VLALLEQARRVVLTTHVNADGDGAGSEAAIAAWLASRGVDVRIANPTPFPDLFRYLLGDQDRLVDPNDPQLAAVIQAADLVLVVDTGEPRRIGRIGKLLGDRPVAVIDHHPPAPNAIEGTTAIDPTACATGELVYDLLHLAGLSGVWPDHVAAAIYAAVVTDTGSFRFSNTTPRTHAIAGDLIRRGVDPEETYRRIFATVPLQRIRLLRAALDRLEVDETAPMAWVTIPHSLMKEFDATADDLDGLIEHARSIEGTEVALLFRETAEGSTKISFRSNGAVDVNAIARRFGGGGHVKAAGALAGGRLERIRREVLDAVREALAGLRREADG